MDNNPVSGPAPTPSPEPTPTPTPNPAPTPTPNIPINNGPATTDPFATPTVNTPAQGKKLPGKLIGIIAGVVVLAIIVVVVLLLTSGSQPQSPGTNPDSNPDSSDSNPGINPDSNPDSNPETNPDSNPDSNPETNPDSNPGANDIRPELNSSIDVGRSEDYATLSTAVSNQRPEVGIISAESYIGDKLDPSGAPYVIEVVEYDPEWPVHPRTNEDGTEIFVVLNAVCNQNSPVASSAANAYVIYGAIESGNGTYCISGN